MVRNRIFYEKYPKNDKKMHKICALRCLQLHNSTCAILCDVYGVQGGPPTPKKNFIKFGPQTTE